MRRTYFRWSGARWPTRSWHTVGVASSAACDLVGSARGRTDIILSNKYLTSCNFIPGNGLCALIVDLAQSRRVNGRQRAAAHNNAQPTVRRLGAHRAAFVGRPFRAPFCTIDEKLEPVATSKKQLAHCLTVAAAFGHNQHKLDWPGDARLTLRVKSGRPVRVGGALIVVVGATGWAPCPKVSERCGGNAAKQTRSGRHNKRPAKQTAPIAPNTIDPRNGYEFILRPSTQT